jgi:uncharacterized protein (DUF342 family)
LEKHIEKVEVRIAADGMKAVVLLSEGEDGPPTLEHTLSVIASAGVTMGVLRDKIESAIAEKRWREALVVAEGAPPMHGADSSVEYLFRRNADAKPVELPDGRVDFKNLELVANVRAGDMLAVRIPPSESMDGVSVRGEPVPARQGRVLPIRVGKNVRCSEDGGRAFASVDGQATVDRHGAINVFPVYEVRGDVGMETGNIRFVGSVVVSGSIAPGFLLSALGNIEVRGFVGGDLVEAGCNLTVGRGIQGSGKGRVIAGGDISCVFVENATVESQGSIRVRDAIMHSNVAAKSRVVVAEGKGVIVGGVTQAGEEVRAKVIGSGLATPTTIEVGVDPELRARLAETIRALSDKEAELQRVDQALEILSSRRAALRQDGVRRAGLSRLVQHRAGMAQELEAMRAQREEMASEVARARNGRVKCALVHPGTRIVMGASSLLVTEQWHDAQAYMSDDGKIAFSGR